ncbi:hypothetical protein GC105_12415 [Alkalibaculum sp. M08DMB]|uniref:DNA ligase (ATP) n=1 Tax=Alkalibaculum sporogenes TaxID=2655001 RepID=A0A6A7KB45_9FIRM|nr:hypothetical protein [Alkalibaculum sporogenes]MPW26592.1 hypothetical protein [Alkalibaculum sporogenes]
MELIKPMEPILVEDIIKERDFIHQIKWDGIRIMSCLDNGQLQLYTKRGNNQTNQYPEIKQLLDIDHVSNAIFDGEVICLKDGKPSFREILIRNRSSKELVINELMERYPVYYIVFDILHLNGMDLTKNPFHERHLILNKIITSSSRIKTAENNDNPQEIYSIVKENELEGIISKDLNSTYISGKTHKKWYKYKLERKMLCVICGININSDKKPKSIILGIYNDGRLIQVGAASSGLTQRDIELLNEYKEKLSIDFNPFSKVRSIKSPDIIWFNPSLTCWISFMEWTDEGVMRHPKILGFSNERMDKADGTEYIK